MKLVNVVHELVRLEKHIQVRNQKLISLRKEPQEQNGLIIGKCLSLVRILMKRILTHVQDEVKDLIIMKIAMMKLVEGETKGDMLLKIVTAMMLPIL